jgi:predicted AAA+ superfamily ATPase
MYDMIDNLIKRGIKPNQILFVNFEDKKLSEESLDDMYNTYRKELNLDEKAYIFFDEIHRKKDWESWIRKKYDLKTNDKFIISGSCSYLLRKEYSTLLSGRNLSYDVFPLSFEEFLLFKNIKVDKGDLKKGIILEKTRISILRALDEYLEFGGFPEVLFKNRYFKTKLLEQYFDDILYKDIIDRYDLSSQKLRDLALYLMTNFTGFISLRSIRNALGISYDTTKDYFSYYKEIFLFFTVDHFSYSFKEQKTLPSKVYCIDNGLRNAVSFKFSKDKGKLAENAVLVELKRRRKDIYYWKDRSEVDFIIKNRDQTLTAINVSYTDDIPEREVYSLKEFASKYKNKIKELVLITENTEKKEQGILFIPLWKWLILT